MRNNVVTRLSAPSFFCFAAAIFGLAMVFITPPFQTPDEAAHFYRAYELSEGSGFIPRVYEGRAGNVLPRSLVYIADRLQGDLPSHPEIKTSMASILPFFGVALRPQERTFIPFTVMCSPVPYLPQVAAVSLARLIGFPPLAYVYAGRVANLAAWLVLVFCALCFLPCCRWTAALVALTPMSLFMAASFSPDALTNGVCFLFFSVCLRYALDPDVPRLTAKEVGLILFLGAMIALSKFVYFFYLAIFFLIPARKFASRRSYWMTAAGLFMVCAGLNLAWSFAVKGLPLVTVDGGDPGSQLAFILGHPLQFARVIVTTALRHVFYLRSFIGILGWFDTHLPAVVLGGYPLLLLFSAVCFADTRIHPGPRQKIVCAAAAGAVFLSIMTVFYLLSPLRAGTILSVSGRYFIPISPAVALLPCRRWGSRFVFDENSAFCSRLCAALVSLSLASALWALINRYYL